MNNRKFRIAVIAGLVLVLGLSGYFGARALNGSGSGPLKASGTIQTVSINVSPELSGNVQEVRVSEGQSVKAGDVLLVLDGSLLAEQRKVAAAGLGTAEAASQTAANALSIAQAQYQQTLATALAQDKQTRVQDWFASDPKQFDQPTWYFSRAEQIQALQAQVDEAKNALDRAQAQLASLGQSMDEANFLAAEQRLENARLAYVIMKDVNRRAQNSVTNDVPVGAYNSSHCGTNQGYHAADPQLTNVLYGCAGDQHLSGTSQSLWNQAQAELTAAQLAYNSLLSSQAADRMLQARAEVSVQQERYYSALDHLRALQTGDQSPSVLAAQGAVNQAQANYNQSQKVVAQAQANLDLIDAQMKKLTLYAPIDGVILTRSIQPGEFIQPGAVAMTMGNLARLTITVYVPEDRYGQIRLGQKVIVHVDSFPGTSFTAQVNYISDQAEFTPRNVQTVEGRSSTVYAIRLAVNDPAGQLKPGMPADVTFGS
ncbi:MAG TPA: efflux RND transporter periplasmic adaptor subunit [Anaerolineales bacterium]